MTRSMQCRSWRNRGLTLIELVLVLIIVAALAGLVIPQVSNLGRTADMAATGKTQADLASNIQLHFVELKRFPQGFDSLITGTEIFLPEDLDGDGAQDTGLPDSGPHLDEQLETWQVPARVSGVTEFDRSLSRSGFDYVFNHDTSIRNANDSAVTQVPIEVGTTLATIVEGSAIAQAIFPSNEGGAAPGTIPDDIKLVAFGVGPNNTLVGKTSLNTPIYPGCDGSYYGRYVAIFKVYADGRRSQLAMVVDAYGRFPDYTAKQFNETLPEGGRRG